MGYGFFPFYPGMACSNGKAVILIQEIDGVAGEKEANVTISAFNESFENATKLNKDLITNYSFLKDFLDENALLQMKLHCGKW